VNADDVLLVEYHDREWGIPAHSDHKHFQVLVLSGVQAGLNWSLVLKKRDGYRRAFKKFDPEKVARYSEMQIRKLLSDPEIIRNRMKIEAAVRTPVHFLRSRKNLGSTTPIAGGLLTGGPSSTAGKPLNRFQRVRPNPRG
jgi:DNA-3-methyladenine glycosylase I